MTLECNLDRSYIQQISKKINLIDSTVSKFMKQLNKISFGANFKKMVTSMNNMMVDIMNNMNYLNKSSSVFYEDFFKAIKVIDTAIDSYLYSLNSISLKQNFELFNIVQNDINNFSKSMRIFISNFQDIISCYSNMKYKKDDNYTNIDIRLGIESVLFSFAVNVHKIEEYPYFKSNFIEIYQFYHKINQIQSPISAIESYCGTGKSLCIPMILLCRSLREKMNIPIHILSQPSPKHVESKEKFINEKLSKYVMITSDSNKLTQIINEYENEKNDSKLVLGLVSPYNLLPMLYNLRRNKNFYPHTRFIIDELSQRTIYFDVLLAKIATINSKFNVFSSPLSVVLTSSYFSNEVLKPFDNKIEITKLVEHPLYEIQTKPPIIERNIYKINNIIVPNEVVNTMKEMSKIKTNIEEGNILCFLSGIGNCKKVQKSVCSLLRHSEETDNKRKIVILQTMLKPNETKENYFKRLQQEYEMNEGIREGKKCRFDYLYFIPLVLSGIVEDTLYEIAQEELPKELKKINKFICSTPMLQFSFTIDKLSVVIDSGLSKEASFDIFTGLTTLREKQVSYEIMNQRKGRLGRTMKGLYIPICSPKYLIPQYEVSPIEKVDLTNYILYLKNIGIDIEKITNLPSNPDDSILDFTMENIAYTGAIDQRTNEITSFGREILNFPFISIYYAASVLRYRDTFEKADKPYATFISAYISLIITMDSILVQEDSTEKLSRYFREDSDIVTLIYALNSLMLSNVTDDNERRELVESYGFSYSSFLVFMEHMQTISNLTFPGKTVPEVIRFISSFIKRFNGIPSIIDEFIKEIIKIYPHWKRIHQIEMKHVSGAGNFESRPTLIFNASDRLKFENQRQQNAEVRITSRPGWNGIIIPSECYCFNISRNLNSNINMGRLVHRISNKNSNGSSCITSIECDKSALNPWFDVLLSSYFCYDYYLNIQYFQNVVREKNKNENNQKYSKDSKDSKEIKYEKRMFHISNVEDRVFVSFIPRDSYAKKTIIEGVNKCLKLLPYTPRSIVVLRSDIDSLIEIKSIGTQHYETTVLKNVCFQYLSKYNIEYCIEHINELAKSDSNIRIGALFINGTCKLNEYDQKQLYLISPSNYYFDNISHYSLLYLKNIFELYNQEPTHFLKKSSNPDELELFQFPTKFIHPALIYNHEVLECVMNWFKNCCNYAHVVKVIGHRFLMKSSEIQELQNHLRLEKDEIKKQMNITLEAIPVPKKIYQKAHLIIKEHSTWNYNNRFKVIIASNDEVDEIQQLLEQIRKENEINQNGHQNEFEDTLCCLYVCDDPDNPVLTHYPLTIYYKDGSTYMNKMCRDCLYETLEIATKAFYTNGEINQEAIENISYKPSIIPSVDSKETENGLECWPQIPLGQMISALINNDEDMSSLVSAWLNGVVEFTIRNQSKHLFACCPDHQHTLYDIKKFDGFNNYCKVPKCRNLFCNYCKTFHDEKFTCEEKKNRKAVNINIKKCPKCLIETIKDGGCNHITCPCGCHWCYKCGKGFTSAGKCYDHLSQVHGGCFDYNFD